MKGTWTRTATARNIGLKSPRGTATKNSQYQRQDIKEWQAKNNMGGSEKEKLHSRIGVDNLKVVNNLYSVVHTSKSFIYASSITDTGASEHYLKADATHDLASWPVEPIQVKQPNVQILHSTKVCKLVLLTIPEGAREAHILPGLAHSSLISIGKLCDAGCDASLN